MPGPLVTQNWLMTLCGAVKSRIYTRRSYPGGRGSTQLELVEAVKTTLNLNRFFGMQELKVTKTTISCL